MLGYVMQRPIPASATLKIKLKGDFSSIISTTDKLQIPLQSSFSYGGYKFILKKTLIINLSSYVDAMILDGAAYESDYITVDQNNDAIDIIQGEIKEKVIEGSTNPLIGSTFQVYKIDDTEFSNMYGSEDYDNPVTRIWIGDNKSTDNEYTIDRRSLINWEVIEAFSDQENIKVAVVRSSINEGVELLFGNGRYASDGVNYTTSGGAITSYDNLYVQYLATKGFKANQSGVVDKKVTYSGKVYTNTGKDITNKVDFYFATNIVGGADVESLESIKYNSPGIFASFSRCVTKEDYQNYLKSLTSPISIKNAIAFGEAEELNADTSRDAVIRLFNVVLFSVLGHLYQVNTSPYYYYTKENGLDNNVLDSNFNIDDISYWNYFNVFVKGDTESLTANSQIVRQLKEYTTSAFQYKIYGHEIDDTTGAYYSTNYGENLTLYISYTTDDSSYNTSLSADTSITVDVRSLSSKSNDTDAMETLASLIQTKLLLVADTRGSNATENTHYNQTAFPNVTVTYDSTDKNLTIAFGQDSPCYIYEFTSATGASDIGLRILSGTSAVGPDAVLVSLTNNLSQNIITVVDKLDTRAQITVKNLYLSPIIHRMKIFGTVKINSLYDTETERTNFYDAIYKWADTNADFNSSLFLSTCIELIEQFPSVVYANVNFEADYPTPVSTSTFYVTGNNKWVNNGFSNAAQRSLVYQTIDDYILNNLESRINSITQRIYFNEFAKVLYNDLKGRGGNYAIFVDTINFNNLISDINKDWLQHIRRNLIDSDGNITAYSINNEIVQLICDLTIEYNS
ncbi:MAG: hypothetical protein PHF86_09230 [Candidatus Nanoarchaeia archaeon]|nr:hypothetical protein [Candidatus Nanoarchaeia archaeon]